MILRYVAPAPTPEQILNGNQCGYDPNDLGGSLPYWDLRPDDTMAAAAVLHDELTLRGGPLELSQIVAENFSRDCFILAHATDDALSRILQMSKAYAFSAIVYLTDGHFWRETDLNTVVTRRQGEQFMLDAAEFMNQQAKKIGSVIPYPRLPWEMLAELVEL